MVLLDYQYSWIPVHRTGLWGPTIIDGSIHFHQSSENFDCINSYLTFTFHHYNIRVLENITYVQHPKVDWDSYRGSVVQ